MSRNNTQAGIISLTPIESSDEFDDGVFSSSEKAVLESVMKHVCCYSEKALEKFTHSEVPWLSARGGLPENVHMKFSFARSTGPENLLSSKIADFF